MGEIVAATSNTKRSGSASIQCPLLTDTNYTAWTMRMNAALKVHKVWEAIYPGEETGEKNYLARALFFQSIPESLILQVGNLQTAKEIWEALKMIHMGADHVREVRLQTLMADFNRLKMKETDSTESIYTKFLGSNYLKKFLGKNIEEPNIVKKFLSSLPKKKYINIIAAPEKVIDLDKTSFKDIVERLKAYEEIIFDEEEEKKEDQGQNKLMYTNTDSQPYQERYDSRKGTCRGDRFWYRGRGRGRFGYQQNGG